MKSVAGSKRLSAGVKFDRNGLVPAVIQSGWKGPVLMVAYMDRRAFRLTLRTGFTHFYSRSRKAIWRKGEKSGHVQVVRGIRLDCDGDTLLVNVRQKGSGACHAGYLTCFHREAGRGRWMVRARRKFDPKKVYR